jgi:pyruvate kinase
MKRRTKIIATIGPSCSNQKKIEELVNAGVNCFRINLSHGTSEEKKYFFDIIKSIKTPSGLRPTILADLAGPKIRVAGLEKSLDLKEGDEITISNDQRGENVIPVSEGVRFQKVEDGAKILINDGLISLEVMKQMSKGSLLCKTIIPGIVENRKGVNFPGIELEIPTLTDQDKKDLELSLKNGADWIALSFVRSEDDFNIVRSKIKELGFNVPIMAKIEKWEAVKSMGKIIETFDAVMVARGDLGVEVPGEKVPIIQKKIIEKSGQSGKPAVIATQLLDSMIERPVPTRAEISDIANSILDGADALMVTGETAIGKHPIKVIKVLIKVINETERSINYKNYFISKDHKILNTAKAISHAACSVAQDQGINTLVTMTHSGSTARMVARYRPESRIIAMTPFKFIARQLEIIWGVKAFVVSAYDSSDEIPEVAKNVLIKKGVVPDGGKFVLTGGVPVGITGTTNYLSVIKT